MVVWWLSIACRPEPEVVDTASPPAPPPTILPTFDGPAPRNLVMLSVDTFRRDHVGRYGSPTGESLTPFLDELMAESFVADDAMACSNWTVASTACVESGADNLDRAPDRGMFPIVSSGVLAPIPQEAMLPRFLYDQGGYSSLLATTNGYFSRSYGNAQGYQDVIYDGPARAVSIWEKAKAQISPEAGGTPLTSPSFLHLHFFEPHRPYTPPLEYLEALESLPEIPFDLSDEEGQTAAINAMNGGGLSEEVSQAIIAHMKVRYQGEVRSLDDGLRQVWTELDELGLLDDALVVFWTDHGEELWDHLLTEHGKLLFRTENDMTLFFWARNIVPGSYDGPVSGIDVTPTVLELLGLERADTMTGLPIGTAPPDRVRYGLTDAYIGPALTVRKNQWKMQFRWGGQRVVVFDEVADPLELEDKFDPTDPVTLELWELMKPRIEASIPYVEQDPRGWELVWPEDLP
ncbi:MAG: sulfatase-like hydrolase/transferase [Myxococcota bacterium]